jgi:hypothetical protein
MNLRVGHYLNSPSEPALTTCAWLRIATDMRAAIITALVSFQLVATPPAEQPRKEAAEEVSEGNAARWLEYYRRERGHNWALPPQTGPEQERARPARTPAPEPLPHSDPLPGTKAE